MTHVDVLVVGAGFSGLYILHKLLEKEKYKVRLVDDGEGPGGTWDKNHYPGARVDSPIWVYQFTDRDLYANWSFTEKYPGWEELVPYFRFVADRWDLWPHMTFHQRVVSATWDEKNCLWHVRTSTGETISTRHLVLAMGSTTQPLDPRSLFPGVERYRGELYHSARWPEGKSTSSLKGRRVGVIGTGASGVQIIQDVALVADHLIVFQRTPNLALPMRQERFTRREYELIKQLMPASMDRSKQTFGGFDYDLVYKPWREMSEKELQKLMMSNWEEGGFKFWLGAPLDLFFDEECNRIHYNFWRDQTRRRIKREELAKILAPTNPPHPFGVKRPCLGSGTTKCSTRTTSHWSTSTLIQS